MLSYEMCGYNLNSRPLKSSVSTMVPTLLAENSNIKKGIPFISEDHLVSVGDKAQREVPMISSKPNKVSSTRLISPIFRS